MLVACSKDDEEAPSLQFSSGVENLVLGAEKDSRLTLNFSSSHSWQASTDTDWITLSPAQGNAGNSSLAVFAKEGNRTGEVREATVTFSAGGTVIKELKISQRKKDILEMKQTTYNVPAEGMAIRLEFTTNLQEGVVKIRYSKDAKDWLAFNEKTKALVEKSFDVRVLPNSSRAERTAILQIVIEDAAGKQLIESDEISIVQEGAGVGTSTDLETDDGKVVKLQTHSKGNGIPVVFMGDGFLDTDIQSGFYRKVMEKGMEHFFSEEPVKSLREYFDVWMVTAVSLNDALGEGYSTKFSCWLEGGNSTFIKGDEGMVQRYTQAVDEIRTNLGMFYETMSIVILNTEAYAGTTYFGYGTEDGSLIEYAIGYCPIISGMESEAFRQVLCHECIGHGFAKLLDEYSYQSMGQIPAKEIEDNQLLQTFGWAMNVDFIGDKSQVIWKHFLEDERYAGADAFGETLSTYEGACTYWNGAWRPTNESMMRSNIHGFNAPSREAIYKRVMETAYGTPW
ncbi:hypothetical protein JCM16496A_40320 [Bacteroides rodentium JCM 16496]